jgi:hypothetical protein
MKDLGKTKEIKLKILKSVHLKLQGLAFMPTSHWGNLSILLLPRFSGFIGQKPKLKLRPVL